MLLPLLIYIFILGIYAVFFSLNVWHLKKFAVKGDSIVNKVIFIFSIISIVSILISIFAFLNIPWSEIFNA